jgi:hypothetical protein
MTIIIFSGLKLAGSPKMIVNMVELLLSIDSVVVPQMDQCTKILTFFNSHIPKISFASGYQAATSGAKIDSQDIKTSEDHMDFLRNILKINFEKIENFKRMKIGRYEKTK